MNFQTTHQGGQLDRALAKSLPCLPGYNFNLNVGADRFHRPRHWKIKQGVGVLSEVEGFQPRKGIGKDVPEPRPRPGIGGCLPPPWAPVKSGPDHSVFPRGHGQSQKPTWLEYDRVVLTFDAYYQEPIPESGMENYRVHHCKIYYFLEDDTVQITEPKTYNSGVPQGQIVRRHRIPLPEPCEGQYYTMEHFNVGCEICIYGKVFYVCACDPFTRKFLNRAGIAVPHNKEIPRDPATEKLKDRKTSQFARKPHHYVDTRGPFNQHSKHVLRFWAYWDDRCKLYGDLRQFIIHYFLSDNTMEIREILQPNSGYEAYPLFLRRAKVPKNPENLVGVPGEKTPMTILNVFGSMYGTKNKKAHYMVDNMQGITINDSDFYKDNDLAIGAVINVYGRPFVLTQCDEFTKQWYKEKYQIENFTPLVLDEELVREIPDPKPPPYNGWGQEDDLSQWRSLEMKPAIKDYRKQIEFEKDILRFEAKFYRALQSVNQSREFIINYFMNDDTFQIFEKEHPNSGLPKGCFFQRSRVKKPGYQPEIGEEGDYYEMKDLFVGNVIKINGFDFQLVSADEFTLTYMEANKDKFPQSDVCICMQKMREAAQPLAGEDLLRAFTDKDNCLEGVMDIKTFRTLLLEMSKCGLSEHEVTTLTRAFAAKVPPPGTDLRTIQSVAQTELRRFYYDRILLSRIEYTLRYHDPCRTGRVDRETLRATLKGAKVPIFKDLLDYLVDKFPSPPDDICNRVDYCEFLRFLDWETNPAPIAKPAAKKCVMKWVEPKPPMKVLCVNYRAFLEQICPNIKSALPSVCCNCKDYKPCPEHPLDTLAEKLPDYCNEGSSSCNQANQGAPPCQPLEPVTVYVQPCSITYTEGNQHCCAPGAQECFANQDPNKPRDEVKACREEEFQTIPSFECAPCSGFQNNEQCDDQ